MSRILLLQGPMGYFFNRFAFTLKEAGHKVFKINFNAGDELFYPDHEAVAFSGSVAGWAQFLSAFMAQQQIQSLVLFGDCRQYHAMAIKIAKENGIKVFVFEEGYIRPDYITFENTGVNGHSVLKEEWEQVKGNLEIVKDKPSSAQSSFKRIALGATVYFVWSWFRQGKFPYYEHHRNFSPWYETRCNWISVYRKLKYKITEQPIRKLLKDKTFKYFAVPLQVSTDSQIAQHSKYSTKEEFIAEVIQSFAQHAKLSHHLIFKHHPLDRGHVHYGALIKRIAERYGVANRVLYAHDVHLPTLLKQAQGVVVINSTVGMSALHHKCRLKVMGEAIYDLPELTYQGSLDKFWNSTLHKKYTDYWKFRTFLVKRCLVHGAFFGNYPKFSPELLQSL